MGYMNYQFIITNLKLHLQVDNVDVAEDTLRNTRKVIKVTYMKDLPFITALFVYD